MRSLWASALIIWMITTWPLVCWSGCIQRIKVKDNTSATITTFTTPPPTTATSTLTITILTPTCDCMQACSPYEGDKYKDCAEFCSHNEEPIPLCMCDEKYTKSPYRTVHLFHALENKTNPKTLSDCHKACGGSINGYGLYYAWTKIDCFCRCSEYDELVGYGLY